VKVSISGYAHSVNENLLNDLRTARLTAATLSGPPARDYVFRQ